MGKSPRRGAAPFFKPLFVTAAAAMIWGAQHEPDTSDIGTIIGWALGMLTVGLLMQAALAVAVPALGVVGALLRANHKTARNAAHNGAHNAAHNGREES
jgi:mannose/fructose/N-acetylgalactosamine-specific phosphotransferase system component IIC